MQCNAMHEELSQKWPAGIHSHFVMQKSLLLILLSLLVELPNAVALNSNTHGTHKGSHEALSLSKSSQPFPFEGGDGFPESQKMTFNETLAQLMDTHGIMSDIVQTEIEKILQAHPERTKEPETKTLWKPPVLKLTLYGLVDSNNVLVGVSASKEMLQKNWAPGMQILPSDQWEDTGVNTVGPAGGLPIMDEIRKRKTANRDPAVF